jgi:hypothetical protein
MDEGVDTVDPVEEGRVLEEPCLDTKFEEDVQSLFNVDEL